MEKLIVNYLRHLDIPVSEKYCIRQIVSHPDYPSLLSIVDTLNGLGIEHKIFRIPSNHLSEVSFPYLIQLEEAGKTNDLIPIYNQKDLNNSALKDHKNSSVIIIQCEPTDKIVNEKNNLAFSEEKQSRNIVKTGLLTAVGLLLLLFSKISSLNHALFIASSLLGGVAGYFLYAKTIGIKYKTIEEFCMAGKRSNCDQVLHSEAATIFGKFKLSDATFSYFLTQLFLLTLFVTQPIKSSNYILLFYGLGIVTIPIVGFSILYQSVKLKTWCFLCMAVNAILISQLVLLYNFDLSPVSIFQQGLVYPAAVFSLMFIPFSSGLILLRQLIVKKNEAEYEELALNRIKHNPIVFITLLNRSRRFDITPFSQEMVIGEKSAPVKVTMAVSLHCNPCKRAVNEIVQITSLYPNLIQLVLRFKRSGATDETVLSPADYLISYWDQFIQGSSNESERTFKLIRDWYAEHDFESFKSIYPMDSSLTGSSELLNEHDDWIEASEINRTPTIIIDNHELPENYKLDDLVAVLPLYLDSTNKIPIEY